MYENGSLCDWGTFVLFGTCSRELLVFVLGGMALDVVDDVSLLGGC